MRKRKAVSEIEKAMVEYAESTVSIVGESTETGETVNGDSYKSFVYKSFESIELNYVWSEFIDSYRNVLTNIKPEGWKYERTPKLILYWRTKPEITLEDGIYTVWARLRIDRLK